MQEMTPREIVARLDEYIVGQNEAKRTVAIALRNRLRRRKLPVELQEEIMPKNIIMIGPTGVGKTEIARRLASMVNAPFIKVEATKFTEVGYVGRSAESMVRELLETAIRMERAEALEQNAKRAEELANQRIVEIITSPPKPESSTNPFSAFMGMRPEPERPLTDQEKQHREDVRQRLDSGELDKMIIEIEIEEKNPAMQFMGGPGMDDMGINLGDIFGNLLPSKQKRIKVPISQARKILQNEEAENLLDMESIVDRAIEATEQNGIIFLDEIDKIVSNSHYSSGPDVSREGVQRDILPIVEGTTVLTKYGPVRTDYILFIAAGAFHISNPRDLIPELQGRFPLQVRLNSLDAEDLLRILQEPKHSLVKQYVALLSMEGMDLEFTPEALKKIADYAKEVNDTTEDIGARRLHTVMEKVLEDLSFRAGDEEIKKFTIDEQYISQRLADIESAQDLKKYII